MSEVEGVTSSSGSSPAINSITITVRQLIMNRFVFATAIFTILLAAWAQEFEDDYGNREERQAATYAYEAPSQTCARAAFGNSYCGGFSSGNGGGCDTYCSQKNYPLSWCRPTFCLCHRGRDLGAECERV